MPGVGEGWREGCWQRSSPPSATTSGDVRCKMRDLFVCAGGVCQVRLPRGAASPSSRFRNISAARLAGKLPKLYLHLSLSREKIARVGTEAALGSSGDAGDLVISQHWHSLCQGALDLWEVPGMPGRPGQHPWANACGWHQLLLPVLPRWRAPA